MMKKCKEQREPIKISEITTSLWRPKEIAARIPDITTRQITDWAEREIIVPALDTGGMGQARIYDCTGIYCMALAAMFRGVLAPDTQKAVIHIILNEEKKDPLVLCLLNIQNKKSVTVDSFRDWRDLNILSSPTWGGTLKDCSRQVISLHAIKYILCCKLNYFR